MNPEHPYLPVEILFRMHCCHCGTMFTAHNDASSPSFGRDRFMEMRLGEGWTAVGMADELALCPRCSEPKEVQNGT